MKKSGGSRRSTLRKRDATSARRLNAIVVDASERSIGVDVSRLPRPQNIYDADLAGIEHRYGDVRLFFGKLKRAAQNTLRTRVEIRYPVETFYKHWWQNSRSFHERARQYVKQWPSAEWWPSEHERGELRLSEMEADKDHSEWANFDYMAHSGTEAAVDFFHLSPGGLARFAKTASADDLELEAILRVQLTVGELLALLDRCIDVASEVESYLPPSVRDE